MTNHDGNLDHLFADNLRQLKQSLERKDEIVSLRLCRRLENDRHDVSGNLKQQWQKLKTCFLQELYENELNEFEYRFILSLSCQRYDFTVNQNRKLDQIFDNIIGV